MFQTSFSEPGGQKGDFQVNDAQDLDVWDASAGAAAFDGDVFAVQRRLRATLLDVAFIRYVPARDLAAHMLLNLDDLTMCWSLATNWLRLELGCQRVDAGFGTRRAKEYYPGIAEAKNADFDVPSFGGGAVDNRDPVMQAMWQEAHPLAFKDIKQDRRVTPRLRQRMSGAGTLSKFGGALRSANSSYGLICADWTEHIAPQESGLYDCFEQTVADVFSPIIASAKEIADYQQLRVAGHAGLAFGPSASLFMTNLTPSEIEVARLVATGLSYKEIARRRGRSFSTIDHQLRSIRQKTGASSTTALVSLLSKADFALN